MTISILAQISEFYSCYRCYRFDVSFPDFCPIKIAMYWVYIPHSWRKLNFSGMERIQGIPVGRHIVFEECLGILRPFRRKASGCWAVQLLHKMRSLAAQGSDKPDKHSQHIQRNPRHYLFSAGKTMKHHETLSLCFDWFCSWFSWFLFRKRPRLLPSWFVVALNNSLMKPPDLWTTPSWLSSLWYVVMNQSQPRDPENTTERLKQLCDLRILRYYEKWFKSNIIIQRHGVSWCKLV